MSENRGGLVRAFLAIGFALFVVCFIVFKSGAVETNYETKLVNGKAQEKKVYRFNAGKIPLYLKSFVAPVTGSKAVETE